MPKHIVTPIKLEKLLIDLQNPRYNHRTSQRDALSTIARDQGPKLYNLAEDIVDKGVNPSDLPIVASADQEGFYVVLEGNRRVAVLKLLSSPSLLSSIGLAPGSLKKYNALVDRAEGFLPTELQCVVLSREDAKNWIMLKHTGENEGVGVVTWDGRARHRFRGSSPALQAIELVESSPLLDDETRAKLPKIAITNIERLLGTPEARHLLGVEVKNDKLTLSSPEGTALGRLAIVVSDVANRIVRVTDLDSKDQRVAYAQEVSTRPLPKPQKAKATATTKPTKPSRRTRVPAVRNSLIPRHLKIHILQPRINRIYAELQKLNAEHYVNSCAVLLRVFVELTIDDYAQRHHISLKVAPKPRGITKAGPPRDMTLREKLKTVSSNLESKGICSKEELKGVRALISNRDHVLSVDTLNAYVHNKEYSPTPTDLKTTWDNLQVFIDRLWAP